ncbi:muscle-specific protein 20-like [Cimex lectularius]|uniref:Calponin-homology (CH) domain-containing protein n=1 Tax=Cimex lectularius TaxID=79782 RepID=A0A8I6SQ08_CIMLE|nr:muscle-specific protein 20-like [Cimex lectularius]
MRQQQHQPATSTRPNAQLHAHRAPASLFKMPILQFGLRPGHLRIVAGKRDPEQELEAQQWIEAITGERFPPGVPYELALRDGIILCKLMNNLLPGSVPKINYTGGDYKFMDNINQFQKACIRYGVPDVDLFQTVDLFEQKNIAHVTMTIFAIGRTAYKHPEWKGPWLGPRPSEENKREWSEEQLRAGEGVIGLQAGQNKGATQAGQNFGATRKILLGK